MQGLLLSAVAALSAACVAAETPPPAPTPLPTSQPAPTAARHDVRNTTAGPSNASSTPSSERITRPSDFVASPQLGAGPTGAHVDGWLVSGLLQQPPSNTAPSSLHQHTTSASQQVNQPSPNIQESEFSQMVHHPLRGLVLPEAPGGAPGKLASVVGDPVEVYLDAVKSQLHRHGDRPVNTGRGELHGGRLEGISSKGGGGDDYTAVQEYLKAVQADFAAAHQQHQQEEADFPAVWGESRARGKPVRFEEDASQTQLGGARGGALSSGGFPYLYEQPGSHVPEVVVPSAVGPKHHGRKKVGVARPSARSSLVQRVVHALAAFIPLGLFLASIQPSVITVNASAPAPGASRQRSVVEPGALLAAGADCEARLLCEAATRGRLEVAEASERALWLAAHQTPEKVAKALGLYEILKAIRTGTCDLYNCRALQDEQLASSI